MSLFNRVKRLIPFVDAPRVRITSTICSKEEFSCILEREHARAERSDQTFSVVDFDLRDVERNKELVKHLLQALANRLRSTDEVGWLHGHHIGVLLYNTSSEGAAIFTSKILELIPATIPPPDFKIHTYSTRQIIHDDTNGTPHQPKSGSESHQREETKGKSAKPVREMRLLYSNAMPVWKRIMDIVSALILLLTFSPVFLFATAMIKMVSPGPVFFRQKRVGYGGKLFTLYKFRTMKVNADPAAHQRHLAELIHDADEEGRGRAMMKLDDPQIIRFGNLLRSTCIDELPQLINVLRGEMSLVGPRPPIPYEVQEYVRWHTGRFDAVPGMTGLWQVSGKNRLSFKDMARLDIRYARQRSFSLDLKILLMTPLAIFYQIRDTLRDRKLSARRLWEND